MRSGIGDSPTDPLYTRGAGAGGALSAAGTSADPSFQKSVGSGSISTFQTTTALSPAAAVQVAPARAGRQSVTITNITGTQPIYFTSTNATTGVTTGFPLAGVAFAVITIPTAAAVFATAPTAAQTVGVMEAF